MTRSDKPRDTPLGALLKAAIRRDGPMSVADFMARCLDDPEHGYYRKRPAIGAGGDFVTAPEISQVFGELIGLWSAVVWQQMGSPGRINLVELGPGRGTLMRDALRAARLLPQFRDALTVHLVDSNETLRDMQRQTLADCGVPLHFHAEVSQALIGPEIWDVPTILIANEFLDALPIEQCEFANGAWRAREVALDGEDLCFRPDLSSSFAIGSVPNDLVPADGDVLETCTHHAVLADLLRGRAERAPLAALFIDYGHASTGFGDTLQGVSDHAHVSPFHAPGETDLSAQVDFQHFANICEAAGLVADGPLTQAEFLGRLGIVERASRLMAANAAQAGAIELQVQRLMAPTGMGSRFLVLGVRSTHLAPLPGLA